jgi:hypothetical protein
MNKNYQTKNQLLLLLNFGVKSNICLIKYSFLFQINKLFYFKVIFIEF